MWRTVLTSFVFVLSALSLWSQSGKLQLQFYGDFDSTVVVYDDPSILPVWSFKQNHLEVFLGSGPDSPVQLTVDVLRPHDLAQLRFDSPWGAFTVGRVLVPFGTFDMHHLYGGTPEEEGVFLPKLWSDIGVIYSVPTWGPLSGELYVLNGMSADGFESGGPSPRLYSVGSSDNNLAKTVGFRTRIDPAPGLWAVLSGSWDPYSATNQLAKALGMGGLDAGVSGEGWSLRAGAQVQEILGTSSYLRWGDYAEALWNASFDLSLRLRAGQMDTNSLLVNAEDQANVNLALLWHLGAFEFDLTYFRNFTVANAVVVGYGSNWQQVLAKVLVTY